jgi:hypothetical protein
MRICPAGRPDISPSWSTALEISLIAGLSRARRRSPACVVETLRVLRASNCTPSFSSSRRIVWLRAEGETPSRAAARVKLRSSATTANAAKLPQSSRSIAEFQSVRHAHYGPLSMQLPRASSAALRRSRLN